MNCKWLFTETAYMSPLFWQQSSGDVPGKNSIHSACAVEGLKPLWFVLNYRVPWNLSCSHNMDFKAIDIFSSFVHLFKKKSPQKILHIGWKVNLKKKKKALFSSWHTQSSLSGRTSSAKCRTEMVPFHKYDWEKGRASPLRSTPICASDVIKGLQTLQYRP